MSKNQFCQSCGLPFNEEHVHFIAKEKDGSDSIYCTFCYADGGFTNPNATVSEMVEIGVSALAEKMDEATAREQLSGFIPTLSRWQNQ